MPEGEPEGMSLADIGRGLLFLGIIVLVVYTFIAMVMYASAGGSTWESSWVSGGLLRGGVFWATMLIGFGSLFLGILILFIIPAISPGGFELECCEGCPEFGQCEDWNLCCNKCPYYKEEKCTKADG